MLRDRLRVELHDGRIVAVPLRWFSGLGQAPPLDRQAWTLMDRGKAITWSVLGLRVSTTALLTTT